MGRTLGTAFRNAPFSNFDEAVTYLNAALWNLKVEDDEGSVHAWAGDVHLATFESRVEAEAFVLGMAVVFRMVGPKQPPQI